MSARAAQRRRRIAVVTGTRAEYGLLTSTMQAIAAEPRLRLRLVVTGIHLLRKFGHTVDDIVRDGWPIGVRVPMQAGSDDSLDQAVGLSRGVAGIARFLKREKIDVVVVLGDRIEAMAGALAAVMTGCILAHVHGGDVAPGDFDDSLRHAITKLAHVHFAATRGAARRIIRLGERPDRVHVVGAPGLDRLRELLEHCGRPPCQALHGGPGAADRKTALIVHHACGRTAAIEERTMDALLRAVTALGLRRIIVYPNTDRGHRGVLRAIERHRNRSSPADVEVHRSLPRDDFLRVLVAADVLVGNSSCGVIEAPLAGTPAVEIGPRQAGREPGGGSIWQVAESFPAIRAAIQTALRTRTRAGRRTVYGDGHAGRRIARILTRLPKTTEFQRKVITY